MLGQALGEEARGAVEDVVDVGEAVRAAVVGIGHRVIIRVRVDFAQEADFVAVHVVGVEGEHVEEVALVHREDVVVAVEVLRIELPRPVCAQIDTAFSGFLRRAGIGPLAHVPVARATRGALEITRQPPLGDVLAEQRLGERAAADVAQAHEQDADGRCGILHEGCGVENGQKPSPRAAFRPPRRVHAPSVLLRMTLRPYLRLPKSQFRNSLVLPVYSVSDLTGDIRTHLERHWGDVIVEGELSNFKAYPGSGHCYFTLKDADAQLRGVMWRTHARSLFFRPHDGMLVRARGTVSMYPQRGETQLVVREMALAGEGALRQAFDALKARLHAEGLFEAHHKKPLPRFPEKIGVVTSASGAALHDVLSILERRYKPAEVIVCGVRVQGLGAAEEIAAAVTAFSALPDGAPLRPDVLIVGRGGGSAEDLWAFNEEIVARSIFACTIPVVSAVGHETDYSIADFVADVRAATPSMAAELAVPHHAEVRALVHGYLNTLTDGVQDRIDAHRQRVETLVGSRAFARPAVRVASEAQRLDALAARLGHAAGQHTGRARLRLVEVQAHLAALDPLRPLLRGYARVEQNGRMVKSAGTLEADQNATIRFHDGARQVKVEN